MHWVLQNNLYNEAAFGEMLVAFNQLGVTYSIHKVVPFTHALEPELPTSVEGRIVVLGSYTLAQIAIERGWKPGAFLGENLDYRVQLKHWGEHMLNYPDAWFGRFKDVPASTVPFFIRPVFDSKVFAGFVTDWPSFVNWRNGVLALTPDDNPTMDGDTEVMVCSNKRIYREFRIWIVNGRAVMSSMYKPLVSSDVDERVIKFAEACDAKWSPLFAYVLDVAEAASRSGTVLKILEVNNLNASGFYAADMKKIIMAIEREI